VIHWSLGDRYVMESLEFQQVPELRDPTLIMAFGGWPDAGEGATQAVKYLVQKLRATKFAEIEPEEFYDFTQTRPNIFLVETGVRQVQWPTNTFHYWQNPEGERDLLLFSGVEPNLRWRTYAGLVIDVMERCSCRSILHLGALLDAVPHTRETRLTGSSNNPDWRRILDRVRAPASRYEGPTGITSAIMESCNRKDFLYTSVWGHAPHYLQATPNYKVSHALLRVVGSLLRVPLNLQEMRRKVAAFEREVEKVVSQDAQIQAYAKRLEEHYDRIFYPSEGGDIPTPEEVLDEVEEFLKGEQRRRGGDGEGEWDGSPEP